MCTTMNERYPRRMQDLDSGSTTNFTSPYSPVSPPVGPSKANAFSPAVVAVIGVLAGAFLIIGYYRIFRKYCTGQHFTALGTRSDGRNGGPSTIVLMEEHAWPLDTPGLEESLISRIPTCKFSTDEGTVEGTECSVCLGEFEEGEELRILPKCNHAFHVPCIDTWLASSPTCPLCRVNIVLAAAAPQALLPVDREPPAPARGPTMSLVPAANLNPMPALINHEIEILQEQHVQEFLEVGQLSGPSKSPSLSSSHASASDVGILDNHHIDMPILQRMRHFSIESSLTPTREIQVVNDPNSQHLERSVSLQQQQLNRQRFYSRARSSGNPKGKHPLSSPQTKRFPRLLAGSFTASRSNGSSSMNQVVVELLAQEIFQNNVGTAIPETRESGVDSSREASSSGGTGARTRHHDSASLELMWSNDAEERTCQSGDKHGDFSSEDEMEDLTERLANAMRLGSNPGSDDEAVPTVVSRSTRQSMKRSNSSRSFGTWPSKQRHLFKHSVVRLKKYGSVSFRDNSLRRSDKVHASEPILEFFMVD